MFTALFLAVSLAFAGTPAAPAPGVTIDMPTFGVTVVFAGDCSPTVAAGRIPAAKAGAFAVDLAKAKAICLSGESDKEVATTIAPAEAQLIRDSGMAVVLGRNVRVVTPNGTRVESGDHLNWEAYAEALSQNPQMLGVGGGYDSRFVQPFVLDQGRAGFMAHPAVPGASVAITGGTAPCGTAAQCQATINAQAAAMAASDQ